MSTCDDFMACKIEGQRGYNLGSGTKTMRRDDAIGLFLTFLGRDVFGKAMRITLGWLEEPPPEVPDDPRSQAIAALARWFQKLPEADKRYVQMIASLAVDNALFSLCYALDEPGYFWLSHEGLSDDEEQVADLGVYLRVYDNLDAAFGGKEVESILVNGTGSFELHAVYDAFEAKFCLDNGWDECAVVVDHGREAHTFYEGNWEDLVRRVVILPPDLAEG
jgi:hypothetical protein